VENQWPEADPLRSMKFRGRVLQSVFAHPIYRQVVSMVIEDEWGKNAITQKDAAGAEKANDDNSGLKRGGEPDIARREEP